MNKYKFVDEGGAHMHLLIDSGIWRPLVGTSSVVGVLAKQLTWWASGLAVRELGWTPAIDPETRKKLPVEPRIMTATARLEQIKGMTGEEYLKTLDVAYSAHSKNLNKAATAGTDLHAVLENYVKKCIEMNDGMPIFQDSVSPIRQFISWSIENVQRFIWSEAHCFDEQRFIGGISDCGVEMKDGSVGILDFKSAKTAYDSHFLQIAGYALQVEKNGLFDENGNHKMKLDKPISFYAVVPFGAREFKVEERKDITNLKAGFDACLLLYKLIELKQ